MENIGWGYSKIRCVGRYLGLRGEYRLGIFENKLRRKIFGVKGRIWTGDHFNH